MSHIRLQAWGSHKQAGTLFRYGDNGLMHNVKSSGCQAADDIKDELIALQQVFSCKIFKGVNGPMSLKQDSPKGVNGPMSPKQDSDCKGVNSPMSLKQDERGLRTSSPAVWSGWEQSGAGTDHLKF